MSQKIPFVNSPICHGLLALCFAIGLGCGSSGSGSGAGGSSSSSSGGKGSGGSSATGGSTGASGGTSGKSSAGGSTTVATTSTGGTTSAGGGSGPGGATSTGGNSQTGGITSAGGSAGTGGSSTKTGGTGAGGSTGGSSAIDAGGGGSSGDAKPSEGCGKAPATLKSATVGQATPTNTISVGGASRQFLVRWPSTYKNDQPYRLHMGLHGYGGDLSENGKDNFGLWSLSKDTTIFVTLAAVGGSWSGASDLLYADAVLKQVESELCIDTSRVMLEGFSMGGAMSWYITGSRPGVYRAVVGHSGGGVGGIPTLSPVAYWGSLGSQESSDGYKTQTDQFAKANGCTIEPLPTTSTGSGTHVCTPYKGCKEDFPVTWCSYDGSHGFQDTDSGSSKTWVPQAVWDFLSPL
jgi:poly(3-hydroxybutyrate) depolymerase